MSTTPDIDLSDIERDALTELVNIAVSGAATRLRALVGSEVTLTVPSVRVASGDEASRTIQVGVDQVLAIRQNFSGRLSGQTMLVFPEDDSAVLVRAVLGGERLVEDDDPELAADTLGEVGNILLLGFLASIGSMLRLTFQVGLPMVGVAHAHKLFPTDEAHVILVIYVNFEVRQISARGYFSLILSLGTFAELREIVSAFVADLMKDA